VVLHIGEFHRHPGIHPAQNDDDYQIDAGGCEGSDRSRVFASGLGPRQHHHQNDPVNDDTEHQGYD